MFEAEKQFRKVIGHTDLPRLRIARLIALAIGQSGTAPGSRLPVVRLEALKCRALTRGQGWRRGQVLGVVHHDKDRLYGGQLQQSLDGLAPSYDSEVVPVLVRIVVLADQLVKSPRVHER